MTKKQFIATSSVGAIPAIGLIVVLALGMLGSASEFSLATWGLYVTTFIVAFFTFASPVAIVLLIPKDAGVATLPISPPVEPSTDDSIVGDEELIDSSDTDGDFDEYEDESDDYDAGATEVASLDDDDEYEDDGDFQVGDDFEDEFDDFDDDEDFA